MVSEDSQQDTAGAGGPGDTRTTTSAPDERPVAPQRSLLRRVVGNPVTGFAPWILLAVFEGLVPLPTAISVALALSLAVVIVERLLGVSTKILAVVDVLAFASFLVVSLAAGPEVSAWMKIWFGELANLVLVLVVVGSMIARVPFTIQYAKDETDPVYWETPVFRRINYEITGAWGLAFLVASIAGFYGDYVLHDNDNIWTGWIIQIFASMVAVAFTAWYPDYATARAFQEAGVEHEPGPTIRALFRPICGYLIPIGVVVLVFGGAPGSVAWALVVVGLVLTWLLKPRSAAA